MAGEWQVEAEVAPGIERVFCGPKTAWFLRGGDWDDVSAPWPARGTGPAPAVAQVHAADGTRQAGVIVPRLPGGMLEDVLRRHGGLSIAQTVGVLLACLTAVAQAPAAPAGRLRMHRQAFALDDTGIITVVPCHTVPADDAGAPQRELGELAYLCLTGSTWQETAMPVRELACRPPEALARVVITLLDAAAQPPLDDIGLPLSLKFELSRVADPAPLPFLPTEAGVPVADAVTAQLRLDAGFVGRLTGQRQVDAIPEADHQSEAPDRRATGATESVRRLRTHHEPSPKPGLAGLRNSRVRRRTRRARRAAVSRESVRSTGPRQRGGQRGFGRLRIQKALLRVRWRLIAGVAAVLVIIAGIGLLTRPSAGPETDVQQSPVADPSADPSADGAPGSEAGSEPESEAGTGPAGTAAGNPGPLTDPTDPFGAFVALSQAREQAYHSGDTTALDRLTVTGSPAAHADAGSVLESFAGTSVTIVVEETGEAVTDGTQATVLASMHTRVDDAQGRSHDFGTEHIRVEMRFEDTGWKVYRVTANV